MSNCCLDPYTHDLTPKNPYTSKLLHPLTLTRSPSVPKHSPQRPWDSKVKMSKPCRYTWQSDPLLIFLSFDKMIFDKVVFDRLSFHKVIFDKVIFDKVIFDWVSDTTSMASLTGFNFRDSRENFLRDAPMERKERKRLKTEWCPTAEETLFTV